MLAEIERLWLEIAGEMAINRIKGRRGHCKVCK